MTLDARVATARLPVPDDAYAIVSASAIVRADSSQEVRAWVPVPRRRWGMPPRTPRPAQPGSSLGAVGP